MIFAPILIPTLNRYDKFVKCVESLSNNTWANQTELYISVDYPPEEKYVSGYNKIKDYLKDIDDLGFKKCHVFFQESNIGARANGYFLIDKISESFDRYILTEDDNVFSQCFLDYINKGLEIFENDERVFFICGYSESKNQDRFTDGSTIGSTCYFGTWGYGTWIKKHEIMYKYITREHFRILLKDTDICKKLYENRPDLFRYFFEASMTRTSDIKGVYKNYLCADGSLAFIDHTAGPIMCIKGLRTVFPVFSLVRNTGVEDGSGVHDCTWTDYNYSEQPISNAKEFNYVYNERVLMDCSKENNKQEVYAPAKRAWILRRVYLSLGILPVRVIMKLSYSFSKLIYELKCKINERIVK